MLLVAPGPLAAQVTPLEPGLSAPDLVLERADWIALEPLSLEELLRTRAGVVVSRRGGMGSIEFVQLGGSGPGRLRVLLNGVEMTEPELEWPRLYTLQVSLLQRLELQRTTDPAVLSLWTRESEVDAPQADFDLSRGGLETRTRRVQFFTPRRAQSALLSYEELLREQNDFRAVRPGPPDDGFGSYSGRSLLLRVDLRRAGDQLLRLQHERFNDESHGGVGSGGEFARSVYQQSSLRWELPALGAHVILDLAHQVWDRHRTLGLDAQRVSEARTRAALDVALPARGAWSEWLRLRAAETAGERELAGSFERRTEERSDAELQARRAGRIECTAWGGVHHHGRRGAAWSARFRAALARGAWLADAQVGRGVSFPGWGETASTEIRSGLYASLGIGRRGERARLHVSAYSKHEDAGSSGGELFFPVYGSGPRRLHGLLAEAGVEKRGGRRRARLDASLSWTPYARGDRSGLPRMQARLVGSLSHELFSGDLVPSLLASWSLETRRDFAPGASVASDEAGDLTLDVLLLRRADFFWSVRNVTDARIETAPGVVLPGRLSLFGLRVRLLD